MIVTTYEHTLARQLAEDLPGTHLRYINRTEILDLAPRRSAPFSDQAHSESA
jgi:hypothetical protein